MIDKKKQMFYIEIVMMKYNLIIIFNYKFNNQVILVNFRSFSDDLWHHIIVPL